MHFLLYVIRSLVSCQRARNAVSYHLRVFLCFAITHPPNIPTKVFKIYLGLWLSLFYKTRFYKNFIKLLPCWKMEDGMAQVCVPCLESLIFCSRTSYLLFLLSWELGFYIDWRGPAGWFLEESQGPVLKSLKISNSTSFSLELWIIVTQTWFWLWKMLWHQTTFHVILEGLESLKRQQELPVSTL